LPHFGCLGRSSSERVELDVVSVARRVWGHVETHAGELRVTTSDALTLDFLMPIIADFRPSIHPSESR